MNTSPRHCRQQHERREADGDAERDPPGLLLGVRVLAGPEELRQANDDRDRIHREIKEPEPGGRFRRTGGFPDTQIEKHGLRGNVRGGRQVEEGNEPPRPRGPREDQEDVKKQRGQERPEQVLREPRELPDGIVRPRRREDVDRERGEAESPEDARRRSALAGHREEADGEVEQPDEREEEIGVVGPHRGLLERDRADGLAGLNDDVVGERTAGEVLLRPLEGRRCAAVREQDAIARADPRRFRRALRQNAPDEQSVSGALGDEAGSPEGRNLPRERDERKACRRGGERHADGQNEDLQAAGHRMPIQQCECHVRKSGRRF